MINEDIDYEELYKELQKEVKEDYKNLLHAVIENCTPLEFSINYLVEIQSKKLNSPSLEEWAKKYIPINIELKVLRFSNLIDEKLYKNLNILFRIRNEFSHKMLGDITLEDVFELLKDIDVENSFIKNLPNNSIKFILVSKYCFVRLIHISGKINSDSRLIITEILKKFVSPEELSITLL